MRFDLAEGFPLVTTKKVHTRSVFGELLWFLRGDTNVKWLQDRGITIWDEWADADGDLGPVYGYQWRSWPAPDGRHIDQIAQVVEQIRAQPRLAPPHRLGLERRPTSRRWRWRRATRSSSSTSPTAGSRCQLYQRSADVFLGVPFNIASYALLTHMVAQVTGLRGRRLRAHPRRRAPLPQPPRPGPAAAHPRAAAAADAAAQPRRSPSSTPSSSSDIEVEGYDPHPGIKAPDRGMTQTRRRWSRRTPPTA